MRILSARPAYFIISYATAFCILGTITDSGHASATQAPIEITTNQGGTRPNDVYSPKLIYQTLKGKQTLVLYFGGWYRTNPAEPPNDAIYRAVCTAPTSCGTAQKVIDPVAAGLGSAALLNNPTIVEVNNNGQDYLIMYMTGVTGTDPNAGWTTQNNKIYYSVSWANDGITWSKPQLLIDEGWLPSATVDPNGHVILYANTNGSKNPNFLSRYDLGPGGTKVTSSEPVVTSNHINYMNIEVKYRASIKQYQIMAQRTGTEYNSEIDFLDSPDGINWTLRLNNAAPIGMTPGVHPDTSCWIYYGVAPVDYQSNIFFRSWC